MHGTLTVIFHMATSSYSTSYAFLNFENRYTVTMTQILITTQTDRLIKPTKLIRCWSFHTAIQIFTHEQEFSAFTAPEFHCCLQKSSTVQLFNQTIWQAWRNMILMSQLSEDHTETDETTNSFCVLRNLLWSWILCGSKSRTVHLNPFIIALRPLLKMYEDLFIIPVHFYNFNRIPMKKDTMAEAKW